MAVKQGQQHVNAKTKDMDRKMGRAILLIGELAGLTGAEREFSEGVMCEFTVA